MGMGNTEQEPQGKSITFPSLGDAVTGTITGWQDGPDHYAAKDGKPDRNRLAVGLTVTEVKGKPKGAEVGETGALYAVGQQRAAFQEADADTGDTVRVTFSDERDTGQIQPMKVYTVDVVARAEAVDAEDVT